MMDLSTASAAAKETLRRGQGPEDANHLTPPNSATHLGSGAGMNPAGGMASTTVSSGNLGLRSQRLKIEGGGSPDVGLEDDPSNNHQQPFPYSQDQVNCICDSLQQRGEFKTLENFLQMYSPCDSSNENISESVLRGKAVVAFENGNFRELYSIIESREFSLAYHSQLQDMWYRAHYKEAESVRGRPLGKQTFNEI